MEGHRSGLARRSRHHGCSQLRVLGPTRQRSARMFDNARRSNERALQPRTRGVRATANNTSSNARRNNPAGERARSAGAAPLKAERGGAQGAFPRQGRRARTGPVGRGPQRPTVRPARNALGVSQIDSSRGSIQDVDDGGRARPARSPISRSSALKRVLTPMLCGHDSDLTAEPIFEAPMRSGRTRQDLENRLHGQNRSQRNAASSKSEACARSPVQVAQPLLHAHGAPRARP